MNFFKISSPIKKKIIKEKNLTTHIETDTHTLIDEDYKL